MINIKRRLLPVMIVPLLVVVVGTVGYVLLEGWSWADSFYMTVITLTTVGFGEVRPLTDLGRFFTVLLLLFGVGSVAYGFSTIGELFLTADLGKRLRRRRMKQTINQLRDHIIVCGYGRVGASSVKTLRENRRAVVVIEREPEKVETAVTHGLTVIEGDATRDEVLREAGIDQATGLIVCTGDDSINLFIVLSARVLKPELYIVVRTVDQENERKMQRAGANRVVSPYGIGGKHMANIMIRPHVTDFLDVVTLEGGLELWMEELVVSPHSPLASQTVGQANIRQHTGVTLVAVLGRNGGGTVTPNANTLLHAGDRLIVVGVRKDLAILEALCENKDVS